MGLKPYKSSSNHFTHCIHSNTCQVCTIVLLEIFRDLLNTRRAMCTCEILKYTRIRISPPKCKKYCTALYCAAGVNGGLLEAVLVSDLQRCSEVTIQRMSYNCSRENNPTSETFVSWHTSITVSTRHTHSSLAGHAQSRIMAAKTMQFVYSCGRREKEGGRRPALPVDGI